MALIAMYGLQYASHAVPTVFTRLVIKFEDKASWNVFLDYTLRELCLSLPLARMGSGIKISSALILMRERIIHLLTISQ